MPPEIRFRSKRWPAGMLAALRVGGARAQAALFAAVFVLLLAIHARTLTDPPYWDALVGAFPQGLWLAHNQFDFVRLALVEKTCTAGGPNVYPFSIYPAFIGILYSLALPPVAVFLILHLVMLVCAAVVATIFFALAREHLGDTIGSLATLVLVSSPLFQSLASQMNMDMPLLACTLLALRGLDRRRFGAAWCWSLLALLVIPRGAIVVAANCAAILLVLLRRRWTGIDQGQAQPLPRRTALIWGLAHLGLLAVFVAQVLVSRSYSRLPIYLGPWSGFGPLFTQKMWTVPEQGVALLLALAGSFALVRRMLRGQAVWHEMACCLFLLVFLVFYGQYKATLPRYFLQLYPHLLLLILSTVLAGARMRALRVPLLGVAVALNLVNHAGALYRPVRAGWPVSAYADEKLLANDGHVLERSMEYRDDLLLMQDIARKLESKDRGHTVVVANWPIPYALAFPEFGYVDRPWRTSSPNARLSFDPNAVPLEELYAAGAESKPGQLEREIVWVLAPNAYLDPGLAPRPGRDELLEQIRHGEYLAFVLRRSAWERR